MAIQRTGYAAAFALGLIFAVARPADAGLTVYTSATSFQSATKPLTDINFNGIAPSTGFVNYAIPTGYTDPGTGTNFTFLNSAGADINITSSTYFTVRISAAPFFPETC